MRIDLADILRPHARPAEEEDPLLADAPLAGSRGQRLQRLQVGLSGLVAMVLLVGLANIIRTNAEKTDAQVVAAASPPAAPASSEAANDPLADAGVIPGVPDASESGSASGGNGAVDTPRP